MALTCSVKLYNWSGVPTPPLAILSLTGSASDVPYQSLGVTDVDDPYMLLVYTNGGSGLRLSIRYTTDTGIGTSTLNYPLSTQADQIAIYLVADSSGDYQKTGSTNTSYIVQGSAYMPSISYIPANGIIVRVPGMPQDNLVQVPNLFRAEQIPMAQTQWRNCATCDCLHCPECDRCADPCLKCRDCNMCPQCPHCQEEDDTPNYAWYLIGGVLLFLIVLVGVMYLWNRFRGEKKEEDLDQTSAKVYE